MQAVPVHVRLTPGEVHVDVGGVKDKPVKDATIWMFRILPRATVKIGGRRERRTHGHLQQYRARGASHRRVEGQARLARSAARSGRRRGARRHRVVVQQNGYGRILGARPSTRRGARTGR